MPEFVVRYRGKPNNLEHLIDRNVGHASDFEKNKEKELQRFIKDQEKADQSPDRIGIQQSGVHEGDSALPCVRETLETVYPGQNSGKSRGTAKVILTPTTPAQPFGNIGIYVTSC